MILVAGSFFCRNPILVEFSKGTPAFTIRDAGVNCVATKVRRFQHPYNHPSGNPKLLHAELSVSCQLVALGICITIIRHHPSPFWSGGPKNQDHLRFCILFAVPIARLSPASANRCAREPRPAATRISNAIRRRRYGMRLDVRSFHSPRGRTRSGCAR